MPKLVLAHTRHRTVIQAAAKAAGLQCMLRAFSPPDLMDLKAPVLLAFDADGLPTFEPDFLQYLRRTHPGGVRYSPAVVFCKTREEIAEWRAAGAIAVPDKAGVDEVATAIRAALTGSRKWVASSTYVGPDRRAHRAVFKINKRRREDGAAAAARVEREAPAPVRVQSPELMHRRISLAAQLLHGSSIESRRAFRAMIDELEVSARGHQRSELMSLARTLRNEAERFLKDGNADTGDLDRAVAQLGRALGR